MVIRERFLTPKKLVLDTTTISYSQLLFLQQQNSNLQLVIVDKYQNSKCPKIDFRYLNLIKTFELACLQERNRRVSIPTFKQLQQLFQAKQEDTSETTQIQPTVRQKELLHENRQHHYAILRTQTNDGTPTTILTTLSPDIVEDLEFPLPTIITKTETTTSQIVPSEIITKTLLSVSSQIETITNTIYTPSYITRFRSSVHTLHPSTSVVTRTSLTTSTILRTEVTTDTVYETHTTQPFTSSTDIQLDESSKNVSFNEDDERSQDIIVEYDSEDDGTDEFGKFCLQAVI